MGKNSEPKENYSVITFNYDLVLENIASYIEKISTVKVFRFLRPGDRKIKDLPYLVKLHGSIDNQTIVPPTWNKSFSPEIELEWKKAFSLIASANHIRFIGYSLPGSDAYARYLFKASILKSENLKSIEVICFDETGNVEKNYNDFITWNSSNYRFFGSKVENFFQYIGGGGLGEAHNRFRRKQKEADGTTR